MARMKVSIITSVAARHIYSSVCVIASKVVDVARLPPRSARGRAVGTMTAHGGGTGCHYAYSFNDLECSAPILEAGLK